MAAGTFTVGDFALFTYYLWFTTELPSYLGTFVGDIKQQEVAIGRLAELIPDEPDAALVEPHPLEATDTRAVMLNGSTTQGALRRVVSEASRSSERFFAGVTPPRSLRGQPAQNDTSVLLDVRNLTCLHPGSDRGVRDVSFPIPRGSFTVITGQIGSGQDDAAARRPRPAAQGWRRDLLERRAGDGAGRVLPAAAQRLHAAGAAAVQHDVAREYPDGRIEWRRGRGDLAPTGRGSPGGAGTGCRRAGARAGHRRRPARGAALRRAGAAQRRSAHADTRS